MQVRVTVGTLSGDGCLFRQHSLNIRIPSRSNNSFKVKRMLSKIAIILLQRNKTLTRNGSTFP